jgi:alpha-glucosidase
MREPEAMEFLAAVPTEWDETRAVDGKISEYVAVARRNGSDWYVGAMNNWTARELEIDFSFLPDGNFQMDAYQDGVNADRLGSDYSLVRSQVTHNTKMKITLASGGGWAARIYP